MNKSRYSEDLTQFTNVLQIGNDRENFKVADFFLLIMRFSISFHISLEKAF